MMMQTYSCDPPGSTVVLANEEATRRFAADVAIEVPSPTFTLVQHYDLPCFRIVHADLYRIAGADELAELGLDEMADSVVVMEWPDRAGAALPEDRIEIAFTLAPDDGIEHRLVHMDGRGAA